MGINMDISTIKKTKEYLLREVIIGIILWIIMLCVLLSAGSYTKARNTSEMAVVEGRLAAKYNTSKQPILVLENGIRYEFEEVILDNDFINIENMIAYVNIGDYLQLIVHDGSEHNYIYALNCT